MVRLNVLTEGVLQPPTTNTSTPTGDKGEVWIHWQDPYWKEMEVRTPQPDPVTSTLPARANDTHQDLLAANRDLSLPFIPVLIILALSLLFTILGNGLVCFVYRTRFRKNTDNLLVVFLAVLEMVVTVLGVPMEIVVLALPLLFDVSAVCKVMRYVQTASVHVVLLTLACIAVDRYWKLTHPTNFLSSVWVRRLCGGAVLLGLVLAAPAPFVFGSRAVPTDLVNVSGVTCGVQDTTTTAPEHIAYLAILLLTFTLTLVLMVVLYVFMMARISRRKSAARNDRSSPTRRRFPQTHRFGVSEDSSSSYGGDDTRQGLTSGLTSSSSGTSFGTAGTPTSKSGRMSPSFDASRVPLRTGGAGVTGKESTRIGQRGPPSMDVQSTHMTRIFFKVTLVAVLTLTPFVVFRTLQVLDVMERVQPRSYLVLYQLAFHLYLLHPPLVPLIYLLCNHSFRRQVCRLLSSTLGVCCKRRAAPSASRENSSC